MDKEQKVLLQGESEIDKIAILGFPGFGKNGQILTFIDCKATKSLYLVTRIVYHLDCLIV